MYVGGKGNDEKAISKQTKMETAIEKAKGAWSTIQRKNQSKCIQLSVN